MRKMDYKKFKAAINECRRILIEECKFPQELPISNISFLYKGETSLMYAHFLTYRAEEAYGKGEKERATYVLGVIETILSLNGLLSTDRMSL